MLTDALAHRPSRPPGAVIPQTHWLCRSESQGPIHHRPFLFRLVLSPTGTMCAHITALSTDRTASGTFLNDLSHH